MMSRQNSSSEAVSESKHETRLRVDDDRLEADGIESLEQVFDDGRSVRDVEAQLVLAEVEDAHFAHERNPAAADAEPGATVDAKSMLRFSRRNLQAQARRDATDDREAPPPPPTTELTL